METVLKAFEPLMHSNSHQKLSKNWAMGQFKGGALFQLQRLLSSFGLDRPMTGEIVIPSRKGMPV
jgi:hypothetical protein